MPRRRAAGADDPAGVHADRQAASAATASIPADKLAETAGVVERAGAHAREMGAERIAIVATAAMRQARNGDELAGAVEHATGVPARVLTEEDEARLAFLGATPHARRAVRGQPVAVVDVGGGSTEIAVGTIEEGVTWSAVVPDRLGLPRRQLPALRPAVRATSWRPRALHAAGMFEGLRPPPVARGRGVGRQRHVAAPDGRRRAAPRRARALDPHARDDARPPRSRERFDLDPGARAAAARRHR